VPRNNKVPRRLAQRYFREIRQLIEEDKKRTWEAFREEIRPRVHQHRRMITSNRLVTNDAMDDINRVLDRLRETAMEETFNEGKVRRIAARFVEALNDRQRRGFAEQVKKLAGFDPTTREPWLQSFMKTAVEENVSHIKSIAREYHEDVETIVRQGVRRGTSINDMAKGISEKGNVGIKKGRFIARDQLGSLHGDLTKTRQRRLGLKKFRWVTSVDERVRDSHASLHDQIFTWKDGARNERGEQIWPGTDYNCRCSAETVVEELEEKKDEYVA